MKRQTATEKYLQRATRGLWGRKRREVREELGTHLFERISAHRVAGLNAPDAEEKALAELGSPQQVSVGMARIYTLPTVMGSSLALVAAFLSVVALWPKSMAQPAVEGSFYWPSEACIKELQEDEFLGLCQDSNVLWLEPAGLKTQLRKQGVKVDEGKNLTMTFPNGAFVRLSSEPHTLREPGKLTRTRAGVISFSEFWRELLEQPGDFWVEGWNNPVVHIGQVRFRIGTEERKVWGRDFYSSMLQTLFFSKLGARLWSEESTTYIADPSDFYGHIQTTEIKLAQPGIYGIVTLPARDMPRPYWMDAAQPSDEIATFEVFKSNGEEPLSALLPEDVRFVTQFEKTNGKSVAILVRLSGQGPNRTQSYEIISPETVSLEPN